MDDPQSSEPQVVEGELVAPEGAEELVHITGLVQTYISKIDTLSGSIKKSSEMLNDLLENDENYKQAADDAKGANLRKNKAKLQVLNVPQARDLSEKLKEAKGSLKEMKDMLSQYLADYQRLSGSSEFEDETGQIRKIVYVAKLVKGP